MTYNLRYTVQLPIKMYEAVHAAIHDTPGGENGLMVHLAWETGAGLEIIEVWKSEKVYDHFIKVVWPEVVARLGRGPIDPSKGKHFELLGLVLTETTPVYF